MSETQRRFTPVPDDPQAASDVAAKVGTRMILAGLHALSQRALTAISDAFTLILVGLVCALVYQIVDSPTQLKIVTVFGFALFCVVIDIIRRRTK